MMHHLKENDNIIMNRHTEDESILVRGNNKIKHTSQSISKDFSNDFITGVAKGNRAIMFNFVCLVNFWDKGDKSSVTHSLKKAAMLEEILDSTTDIIFSNFPVMFKKKERSHPG